MARLSSSSRTVALRDALAVTLRRIRFDAAHRTLHGRTLVLARVVWLTVVGLTCVVYLVGVVAIVGQLRRSCVPGLCVNGRVPPAVTRQFAAAHLSLNFYGWYSLWLNIAFASVFAAVAALIFWRKSHDPLALFVSLALLLFGVGSFEDVLQTAALTAIGPGWRLPVMLLSYVGEVAFGIFISMFPDGRFVPRWARLTAVGWALLWLPLSFFPGSPLDFTTWPGVAFFGVWAIFLSAMAAAQVYRYRHVSTPLQRIQTKWAVFGFVIAGIGYFTGRLFVFLLGPVGRGFWPPLTSPRAVLVTLAGVTIIYVSMLMIPVCIAIAMHRHHLFDIDVIIRRTLIYSLVTGTLGTIYAVSGIMLQAGFYALTKQGSALAAVGSTLAIVALFQPVRSRVQTVVDRRFYRRKYDAAKTLETFGASLRTETNLEDVHALVLAVVEETMQPAHVSLWLRVPGQQRGSREF